MLVSRGGFGHRWIDRQSVKDGASGMGFCFQVVAVRHILVRHTCRREQ